MKQSKRKLGTVSIAKSALNRSTAIAIARLAWRLRKMHHFENHKATRKVYTEWGIYHICDECWAAHPIPAQFLRPQKFELYEGDKLCECEHISHSIKVTLAPFNPDGGEL
jgi:hypothetical protein